MVYLRWGNRDDRVRLLDQLHARTTTFDLIIVLGGGVPPTPRTQLPFVANRCDAAAAVRTAQGRAGAHLSTSTSTSTSMPAILTLSAGTAHCPQLMSARGLPVWEATASAAYLMDKHKVPESALFVETTSYDTIGNAFFARTAHCDLVQGWRRILVVTSHFHMPRSEAIFRWVFGGGSEPSRYDLTFLATPDAGLSAEEVAARGQKEAKSLQSVQRLAAAFPRLEDVREFLMTKHDLYAAAGLVKRSSSPAVHMASEGSGGAALLKSYGAGAGSTCGINWPRGGGASGEGGGAMFNFLGGFLLALVLVRIVSWRGGGVGRQGKERGRGF